MLEKAGILTTFATILGTGCHYAPIKTVLTTLELSFGTSAVCLVQNKVIKPTDKILGFIFKPFIKVVEYFIGDDSNPNPDIGIIGNDIITLCGNSSKGITPDGGLLEGTRKLIFGEKTSDIRKNKEKEAYNELINEFYKQVKQRKFKENDNNVLMFCVDSTDVNNIKTKLKFEKTNKYK